jgi:peptide/nickel transport system ATP-binding protein
MSLFYDKFFENTIYNLQNKDVINMDNQNTILQVDNLTKNFTVNVGYFLAKKLGNIRAVDSISFDVRQGETFGLVGESGCGKTTAGRIIAGLIPADSGRVIFRGDDIFKLPPEKFRTVRREIQMIFQDPLSSLNPRMTIFDTISEPLLVHNAFPGSEFRTRASQALEEVNLSPELLDRYPHQLSGGQRQRVLIARSLILSPSFIVADEPVSALDVSIQAQILNLLLELQSRKNFSCLFVSHDLAVIKYVCKRVGVMYMGRIVEIGPAEELFNEPLHPYTKALKKSSPDIKKMDTGYTISGNIPDPTTPPTGCTFHPRCPEAFNKCRQEKPELKEVSPSRLTACHLYQELLASLQ